MVYKKKVFALTFMTGYKTFVTGIAKSFFVIFLGVRMVVSFTEILLFGLGNNGCLDVASVKKRIENVGKYYKFVSVFGNILQNSYPLVI